MSTPLPNESPMNPNWLEGDRTVADLMRRTFPVAVLWEASARRALPQRTRDTSEAWVPAGEVSPTDLKAFRQIASDFDAASPNWALVQAEMIRMGYGGSVRGSTVGQAAALVLCGRARELGKDAKTSDMTITPFSPRPSPRQPGETSKQDRITAALESIVQGEGWLGSTVLTKRLEGLGIANVAGTELSRALKASLALRAAKGRAAESVKHQIRTVSGGVDLSETPSHPAEQFAPDGDPATNAERQELLDLIRARHPKLGAGNADALEAMSTDDLEQLWDTIQSQGNDLRRDGKQKYRRDRHPKRIA